MDNQATMMVRYFGHHPYIKEAVSFYKKLRENHEVDEISIFDIEGYVFIGLKDQVDEIVFGGCPSNQPKNTDDSILRYFNNLQLKYCSDLIEIKDFDTVEKYEGIKGFLYNYNDCINDLLKFIIKNKEEINDDENICYVFKDTKHEQYKIVITKEKELISKKIELMNLWVIYDDNGDIFEAIDDYLQCDGRKIIYDKDSIYVDRLFEDDALIDIVDKKIDINKRVIDKDKLTIGRCTSLTLDDALDNFDYYQVVGGDQFFYDEILKRNNEASLKDINDILCHINNLNSDIRKRLRKTIEINDDFNSAIEEAKNVICFDSYKELGQKLLCYKFSQLNGYMTEESVAKMYLKNEEWKFDGDKIVLIVK